MGRDPVRAVLGVDGFYIIMMQHNMFRHLQLTEGAEIQPVKAIDGFLDSQIEQLGEYLRQLPDFKPKSWDALNQFFLSELDRMEQST